MRARVGVHLTLAAIVSGMATYVVLLLAAHQLTLAQNATFLVFWGAMSFGFGVFTSIQSDATRAAALWAQRASSGEQIRSTPRLATMLWTLGLVVTLGAVLTSPTWSGRLFLDSATSLAVIAAIGQFGASTSAAYNAVLVGHGRNSLFALVILLDGLIRLAAVATVVVLDGSLVAVAIACMIPSFTWLVPYSLVPASRRELCRTRADRGTRGTLSAWAQTVLASVCISAIIVGFPVLARVSSTEQEFGRAAPLLLAIALVRGPLLLPLGAMQTVIIGHVAKSHGRAWNVPARWILSGAVAAAAAIAFAAVAGPPLLRLAHRDYIVQGEAFAGIAAGASLLAVFTLASTIVLGQGRHTQYLVGWIVALAAVCAVLASPLPFEPRVVASLVAGPLVGMTVHGVALVSERLQAR